MFCIYTFKQHIYYPRYDIIKLHTDIFSIKCNIDNIDCNGMLLFSDKSMEQEIDLKNIIFVR